MVDETKGYLEARKIVFVRWFKSADADPKLGGKHASNSSSGDEFPLLTTSENGH